MAWLDSYRDDLLKMAGYPVTHELVGVAIEFAEQAIESYTGRVWGLTKPFTMQVTIAAKSYALPLPPDTTLVTAVNGKPVPDGVTWSITGLGLKAISNDGRLIAWTPGVWTITGQHGSTLIPPAIIKAASLLVSAFISLSDAQRSQMLQASRGDLSYSMRYSQLPVPEAEMYLAPYVDRIAGGLV